MCLILTCRHSALLQRKKGRNAVTLKSLKSIICTVLQQPSAGFLTSCILIRNGFLSPLSAAIMFKGNPEIQSAQVTTPETLLSPNFSKLVKCEILWGREAGLLLHFWYVPKETSRYSHLQNLSVSPFPLKTKKLQSTHSFILTLNLRNDEDQHPFDCEGLSECWGQNHLESVKTC